MPLPLPTGHVAAMTNEQRFPARLIIGLVIVVATDTALQLVWKGGVTELPTDLSAWDVAASVLRDPIFLLVIGLMAIQLVNWLKVLDHADLSFAKSFTSLSYVSVYALSVMILNEHVAPMQVVGIAVVVAGVWFVGLTPHKTPDAGGTSI